MGGTAWCCFIQRKIFHLPERSILLVDTSMISKLRWNKNIHIAILTSVAEQWAVSLFLENLYKTLCQHLNIPTTTISENICSPIQQKITLFIKIHYLWTVRPRKKHTIMLPFIFKHTVLLESIGIISLHWPTSTN